MNVLHEHFQIFVIAIAKLLQIDIAWRFILSTVRTNVLINVVGLSLRNSDAFAMEPILTLVTANVESENSRLISGPKGSRSSFNLQCGIIGSTTETEQLL